MTEMNRILIIDDTPSNIKVLHELLRDTYRISVATSGADALDLISREPPDMILLDIMMPEMDGYEVCRRLNASEKTAKIPIIFVTSKAEIQDEQKGLELGAVDYISKPISPSITLARIKNHLELKQARDHLEELVLERTKELQRKVKELEARDRLVHFQMQSPDMNSAGLEILKEISQVIDVDGLCLFFPVSPNEPAKLEAVHELSLSQGVNIADLKTEKAMQLVSDAFREKKLKLDETDLIASPVVYQEEVLGVVLLTVSSLDAESKQEIAATLWRMANEAAMVLRMANFTEDLKNNRIDFDHLLDIAEKNL